MSLDSPSMWQCTELQIPVLNSCVICPIFDVHTAAILESMYLLCWSVIYGVSFLSNFIKVSELM
jgi:hypothetical protein